MEKFECKGYADCCRNFKQSSAKERVKKFSSVNVLNLAIEPENIGIPVFDWEVQRMKDEAQERGIYLGIKPLWVAIDHKDQPIVVMWSIDHNDCPFLEENKCSVYEKRPTICRSFPVTDSGLIQAVRRDANIRIASSNLCRCWNEQIPEMGQMTVSEMYKFFYGVFGSSYKAALEYDMQMIFIMRIMQDLVNNGKIKPVYVDSKKLEKMLAKGSMGFSRFLEIEKIMPPQNLALQIDRISEVCEQLVNGP